MVSAVTEDNIGMINSETLSLMQLGAGLLLLNRAAIADFVALVNFADQGKIRLATDVFPEDLNFFLDSTQFSYRIWIGRV